MRAILFRGKRKDTAGWFMGDLIQLHDGRMFIVDNKFGACIDENGNFINTGSPFVCEVIPETVGQYTGLADKNGKKIFEGDIVRIAYCFGWDEEHGKNVPEEEYTSKVYSIDGCPFCIDLLHCDGDMSPIAWLDWVYDDAEIEIIGNIHDNPELLKGDDK